MSQWWQCPRCGTRLLWQRFTIRCPRERCGYATTTPTPITTTEQNDQQ